MGTNYYLHIGAEKKCPTCHQPTETVRQFHIGKSSIGWTFLFRGYKVGGLSPTGMPIVSVADWKAAMSKLTCLIFNEHDQLVSQAEFWELVEAKKQEITRNGVTWKPKVHAVEYPGLQDWLDPEGNTFSDVKFS